MAENKVRTKTELFQEYLQKLVSETTGVKVSKQKAWTLFKEFTKGPFAFMLANYDEAGKPEIKYGEKLKVLELPLAGVGTFKIIPIGKAESVNVKGRWYISSSIDRAIQEHLGFAVAEAVEDSEEAPAEAVEAPEVASTPDIDLDII